MPSTFLSNEELAVLTGRKLKSKQVEALRHMGICFFLNASGRPIVTRSVIEGRVNTVVQQAWQPKVLMR